MRFLLPIIFLLLPAIATAEIVVSNAWIKNLPPTVPVRAGYMSIYNPDSMKVSIISVSSTWFASVEVHHTIEEDGIMRMEHIPLLTIGANVKLDLEPGGIHLMMMQPLEPTIIGEKIEITIKFDDGSQQNLIMTVKK